MEEPDSTIDILKKEFPDFVLESNNNFGEETIVVKKEGIMDICRFCKNDFRLQFNFLMDLTVVDYLGKGKKSRFEVVYHLYSLKFNSRIRIKAPVSDSVVRIDSIVPLWAGANWMEREAFDMYGITFTNHPDLRRILLYKEFVGHPLCKDYPLNKRQPLVKKIEN